MDYIMVVKMNKKEIKDAIESYECKHNGLRHINRAYVRVLNMRILKGKIIADVILSNDINQTYNRFNNCEYDLSLI